MTVFINDNDNNMLFHHIGIAVHSIESGAETYKSLGFQAGEIFTDPLQRVRVCFLSKSGHPAVELIQPLDAHSPVSGILGKSGPTPYHLCYTTDDIDKEIIELRTRQFLPLSRPAPAVAFGMIKICFLYNKNIGLIELIDGEGQ